MLPKQSFLCVIISVGLFLSVFTSDVWGRKQVKYSELEDGTIFFTTKIV
jgi:hypothetical protein